MLKELCSASRLLGPCDLVPVGERWERQGFTTLAFFCLHPASNTVFSNHKGIHKPKVRFFASLAG